MHAVRACTELTRQPAIIVMATGDLAAVRSHDVGHDADAVLGKPVTSSALFDAVTQAISARAEPRRLPVDAIAKTGGRQRLVGARLLVVDDSELNRIVVSRIMKSEGAQVETANDGLDAVARVHDAPDGYDAVLMDVQMPELDGIEATRRIRSIARCSSLPIIAVTAGALAAERQLVLDAGVNDVISKPFDPEVVVAIIRKHIKRVRGRSIPIPLSGVPRSRWPAVDGIDARDAELRLGGNVALFCSLLGLLAVDLDVAERALSSAPTDADPAQLAQRLHTLRGTAGNLGARDLHAAATHAERWLRAGQVAPALEGVERVLEQIVRLRRSIAAVRSSSASNPSTASTECIDPTALAAFLQRLRDRDMDASTSTFAQSPALAGALGDREHARMRSLLDRLDFEAALQILQSLVRPLPAGG
ncbi:MAG: response regulator [Myxococcales bacterium]|nr:response regulator [Myxococcales bacterium]